MDQVVWSTECDEMYEEAVDSEEGTAFIALQRDAHGQMDRASADPWPPRRSWDAKPARRRMGRGRHCRGVRPQLSPLRENAPPRTT